MTRHKHKRPGKSILFIAVCAILLTLVLPAQSHSTDILVIGNNNLRPVIDVINSIRETLDVEVAVIPPEEAKHDLEATIREENAKAVIALGINAVIYATSLPESIPVIYGLVIEPIETKRKNITGVYMSTPVTKYISFIKKHFPGIKKVGIICHPDKEEHINHETTMPGVVFYKAKNSYEFIDGLKTLADDIDAVLLLPERELITSRMLEEVYLFSFREKVPVIGISEKYVKI